MVHYLISFFIIKFLLSEYHICVQFLIHFLYYYSMWVSDLPGNSCLFLDCFVVKHRKLSGY